MPFILSNKKKESTLILLSTHQVVDNPPFRYSTGINIKVDQWDQKSQKAITKGIDKIYQQRNTFINSELSKYNLALENAINDANLKGIKITKSYLKDKLDSEFKENYNPTQESSTDTPKTWKGACQIFLDKVISGQILTREGKRFGEDRIQKFKSIINLVIDCAQDEDLLIDDIDMNFIGRYIQYRNFRNIAQNTLSRDIAIIKKLLRATHKEGLHNNRLFENEDVKVPEEEVENEFLNDEELDILWNHKFESPKLELTRDVFLIGCYTGLRVSDLSQLNRDNIIENKLLKVITEKTDTPVFIPLHWRVLEILRKHNGPPKTYSDQKLNDYIKEMCKEAGINGKAYYKQTRGGKVVKEVKEKWQRITNHTARRSFATNLYLAGFDTISIMKLTGHKTEENFMKYICVTQRQMADRMLEHPYFKKPIKK